MLCRWKRNQSITMKEKHVIEGRPFPTVMVEWDRMEDVAGWEKGGEVYNKDKEEAWRRDG